VTAFYLVTDDGSDPPIMEVLGIKASEATGIVDPSLGVQVVDTDTTNLRMLVERYLKSRARQADADDMEPPALVQEVPPSLPAPLVQNTLF
jgi:hypothetical protein